MSQEKWVLTTNSNYQVFIFDIISRVGITFLFWEINIHNSEEHRTGLSAVFTILFFLMMHIIVTLITFYIAKRRKSTLSSFIEQRVLSFRDTSISGERHKEHVLYKNVKVDLVVPKLKEDFILAGLTILVSLSASASIGSFLGNYHKSNEEFNFLFIAILFLSFIIVLFAFISNRFLFVSSNIISVKRDDKIFNKKENLEFIEFLCQDSKTNSELYYQNDLLIAEHNTQINIYHERLKSLSYEAVFIGALTFATFIQLTSPENIDVIYKYIKTSSVNGVPKHQELLDQQIPKALLYYPNIWMDLENRNDDDSKNVTTFMLLILGSLLSSSFYVIVLLKRFSVAKSIYVAKATIEKASIWNEREEKLLEKSHQEPVKENILTATNNIQIELAKTSSLLQNIKSNLRFSEATRHLGLYCFFSVLIIGALFFHKFIALFVLFTAIYGIIASYLMGYRAKEFIIKFKRGYFNY